MRTLLEINKDIEERKNDIDRLQEEIAEFINQCPHPSIFVDSNTSRSSDEYGSLINDYYTTHICSLCSGKWVKSWQQPHGGINKISPPTLLDILADKQ